MYFLTIHGAPIHQPRHLIDHHVGPEKFLHLFGDIVTGVDLGGLELETGPVEVRGSGFMQGAIEAAIGVGELLAAVEEQNLLHAGLPVTD